MRLYSVEWVYQTETETAFHFRENQALRNQTMTTAPGHYSKNERSKAIQKTTKLRYRTER